MGGHPYYTGLVIILDTNSKTNFCDEFPARNLTVKKLDAGNFAAVHENLDFSRKDRTNSLNQQQFTPEEVDSLKVMFAVGFEDLGSQLDRSFLGPVAGGNEILGERLSEHSFEHAEFGQDELELIRVAVVADQFR